MISSKLCPLLWEGEKLQLIDQRKLPREVSTFICSTHEDCFLAIKEMVVRGAPLIGFTGIFGLALWKKNHPQASFLEFQKIAQYLISARPTAVNLRFEIERVVHFTQRDLPNFSEASYFQFLVDWAHKQMQLLHDYNLAMAQKAREVLKNFAKPPYRLMTLCNTGFLACGTLGTALGVMTHLHEQNEIEHVYASETRPYLQGLRLTAFELMTLGISHSVVVEGAASYLMREKKIDAIFVGADRIVANGDTANKIGTASFAAVAKYYGIPFFVVAPTSSFDLEMADGFSIPIELRDPDEILAFRGEKIAADGVKAINPSFDITSSDLIQGIFCEKGYVSPVTKINISDVVKEKL